MDNQRFVNKVVIVTGGAQGPPQRGSALALDFIMSWTGPVEGVPTDPSGVRPLPREFHDAVG